MKGRKQKMEEYIQKYNKWLADPVIDEKSKKELKAIEGNEEEIKERFYKFFLYSFICLSISSRYSNLSYFIKSSSSNCSFSCINSFKAP